MLILNDINIRLQGVWIKNWNVLAKQRPYPIYPWLMDPAKTEAEHLLPFGISLKPNHRIFYPFHATGQFLFPSENMMERDRWDEKG